MVILLYGALSLVILARAIVTRTSPHTPQNDLHVLFYLYNLRVRYAITRANVARPVISSLTRLSTLIQALL